MTSAEELDLDDPVLSCMRRSRRCEICTSEDNFPKSDDELYWNAYLEAMDLIFTGINYYQVTFHNSIHVIFLPSSVSSKPEFITESINV